jgi:outer membrane protein assembly factor BamB
VRPNRLLNVLPVGSGLPQPILESGGAVIGFGAGASASASPAVPGQADSTLVIAALDTDMSGIRSGYGRNIVALKSEEYGLVPQWEAAYGMKITAAPTVDHATGNLFVATWNDSDETSRGGRLYCLHASNGQPAWPADGSIPLPGGVLKAAPWFDSASQTLLFGATNGAVYGVAVLDGAPRFRAARLDGAAGSFEATPVVVDGVAYIGSSTGRLYAFAEDRPDDFSVYISPDGGSFESSPSASGSRPGRDVVVLGSTAGKILAFTIR